MAPSIFVFLFVPLFDFISRSPPQLLRRIPILFSTAHTHAAPALWVPWHAGSTQPVAASSRFVVNFALLHLLPCFGFQHFWSFYFYRIFIETFLHSFRQADMYLLSWLLTLFSKNIPLEVAARIWDGHLIFGEAYLVCACLGVLRYLCVDL